MIAYINLKFDPKKLTKPRIEPCNETKHVRAQNEKRWLTFGVGENNDDLHGDIVGRELEAERVEFSVERAPSAHHDALDSGLFLSYFMIPVEILSHKWLWNLEGNK